ncbi:uncharacterized protein LOC127794112 [Diospyros lotus]|uniref:uncharacterized protein LOC127794112 n=1 Tax=Diospyros lotus TaxID=55363 RepID=UPI00224F1D5B|nr:uncharacterized protein LOC127794112 [Diospyros lotus]
MNSLYEFRIFGGGWAFLDEAVQAFLALGEEVGKKRHNTAASPASLGVCCAVQVARWRRAKRSIVRLIHNTIGDTIKFVKFHDFFGQIGTTPQEIPNGQWGMFLRTGNGTTPFQSEGAVVYRCKNSAGKECDWMMSWSNTYGLNQCRATSQVIAGHI